MTIRYLETEYRGLMHPFYPLLCIGIYWLFGGSQRAVTWAQMIAFGGLAWVVYEIGREVFSKETGFLATLFVCLHPGLFIYTTRKLHPLLFDTLWFSLFLLFTLKIRKNVNVGTSLLGGILLGVAFLSRSTLVLFAGLACGWLFRQWTFYWKKKFLYISVLLLTAAAVLVPWAIRNAIAFQKFVPITTTFSLQLWLGNNPHASGTSLTPSGEAVLSRDRAFLERIRRLDELNQSRAFQEAAFGYIREHPLETFQLFLKKLYYFWWFSPQSGLWYPSSWLLLYQGWYGTMLGLGIIGMWRGFASPVRREMVGLLILYLFSISFLQSFFFIEGRHRWIVEPVLLVFSAEGARFVWFQVRTLCAEFAARLA
ncbi:MAG: glycosyltransferase family 39 protein [Candidatus Omnitrophica bacterium]|nr:glycosyltransferase family 39 protein [Candidatus Omnitrophota bacterium]